MSTTVSILELKEILADIFDMDVEDIDEQADFFDELGVDSLVALQLIVKVERQYGIKLGGEFMAQMTNLAKVHEIVNDKLAQLETVD